MRRLISCALIVLGLASGVAAQFKVELPGYRFGDRLIADLPFGINIHG